MSGGAKTRWRVLALMGVMCAVSAVPGRCLDLSVSGGRLTLHARNTPLQDILRAFSRLGIAVQADPGINPPVSASFEDADIRRALNTIIHPYSSVLIWKSVPGPLGPLTALAGIRIFEPGGEGRLRLLPSGEKSKVIRDPRSGMLYVADELLVQAGPGVSPEAFRRLLAQVRGTLVDANAALGIYRVRVPSGSNILSLVRGVNGGRSGMRAEPNTAWPLVPSYRFAGDTAAAAPPLPENSTAAGRAPVAVLDSGLLPGMGVDPYVVAALDSVDPADPISDPLGHGTQMAMIAAGLVSPYGAPAGAGERAAAVIPVRIFDERGLTSNFTLMQSLDFALERGARVISLSWGTETPSDFLEQAVSRAAGAGAVVVAAAGNRPTGRPVYPAAFDTVIGVGALAPDGRPWEKTNRGDFVSLYAPGFASFPVGYKGDPGGYAGTSISTAYVARRISDYLAAHPTATREKIYRHLGIRPPK